MIEYNQLINRFNNAVLIFRRNNSIIISNIFRCIDSGNIEDYKNNIIMATNELIKTVKLYISIRNDDEYNLCVYNIKKTIQYMIDIGYYASSFIVDLNKLIPEHSYKDLLMTTNKSDIDDNHSKTNVVEMHYDEYNDNMGCDSYVTLFNGFHAMMDNR